MLCYVMFKVAKEQLLTERFQKKDEFTENSHCTFAITLW